MKNLILLGLAGLLLAGCADLVATSEDTSCQDTTAKNVAGNWEGTASDNFASNQTITMTLTQQGECFSGAYTSQTSGGNFINAGQIEGTIDNGGAFEAILTFPNSNSCPFRVTGTVTGSSMSGNYNAFNCTGAIVGSFVMSRL